jgi:hypothetical protein
VQVRLARSAGEGLDRLACLPLALACISGTAFTVSALQPPGPDAFSARATHFLVQAFLLWLLVAGLMGVSSNGWPGLRSFVVAALSVMGTAVLWGVMPF